jgi:hypothetical protein
MLGHDVQFEGVPFFWTYHYGERVDYLGAASSWDEVHIEGDLCAMEFIVFYLERSGENRIVKAVLSCGRETKTALLAEMMRAKLTVDQAVAAIS